MLHIDVDSDGWRLDTGRIQLRVMSAEGSEPVGYMQHLDVLRNNLELQNQNHITARFLGDPRQTPPENDHADAAAGV